MPGTIPDAKETAANKTGKKQTIKQKTKTKQQQKSPAWEGVIHVKQSP